MLDYLSLLTCNTIFVMYKIILVQSTRLVQLRSVLSSSLDYILLFSKGIVLTNDMMMMMIYCRNRKLQMPGRSCR